MLVDVWVLLRLLVPLGVHGSVFSVTHEGYEPLGAMKIVCNLTGHNPLLYLEVDADKWRGLAGVMSGFDIDIPVPEECPPFKNAFVAYPVGQVHPPFDGRQFNGQPGGGYGVPHVDVHFLVVTGTERKELTQGCAPIDPGPTDSTGTLIQCDYSVDNEGMRKFTKMPPSEYTTGFQVDMSFGGHAIIGHGLHLLPRVDMIGTGNGPAHCRSTGPTGSWADCNAQFMGFVVGGQFVDQNCTCGRWHDLTSAIMNVFDGKVLGNEVMPGIGIVDLLSTGQLPNPYTEEYPSSAKYDSSGHQPVATWNEYVAEGNKFRTGLVLNSEYTHADHATKCSDAKRAYRASGCCGAPERPFTLTGA